MSSGLFITTPYRYQEIGCDPSCLVLGVRLDGLIERSLEVNFLNSNPGIVWRSAGCCLALSSLLLWAMCSYSTFPALVLCFFVDLCLAYISRADRQQLVVHNSSSKGEKMNRERN